VARILIIDDDQYLRLWLKVTFEKAGHLALEAEDGLAAMHVLRRQRVDLAFCDMCMPRQGGLETIRQIRREGLGVPVVAMSGSDWGVLDAAVHCGAASALQKPVDALKALTAAETILAETTQAAGYPRRRTAHEAHRTTHRPPPDGAGGWNDGSDDVPASAAGIQTG
jgi:two-component system chemotaxis response regulator CheY